MSEATHAPPPHPDGQRVEEHPEVAFEPRDANLRTIVITGIVLAVVIAITLLACWWVFDLFSAHQDRIKRSPFPLVREGANQPPEGPPLEGIQAINGTVTVMGKDGKTTREFAIDMPIVVARDGKTKGPDGQPLNVFDLGVGTEVTVVYEPPIGHMPTREPTTPVAQDRVITIETPPEDDAQSRVFGPHRLAFTGRITKLMAISPEYRHFQAKVELDRRPGWVDEKARIVHIPLDMAMEAIAAKDGGTTGKPGKAPTPSDARPGAAPVGGPP